jgi:nucleotidyltransferase substrate binding protein (TIGR01987 family)
MIDLTPLTNATKQLVAAIEEQKREPERTLLRDGLIQRFEFTYELAIRMMRKYLEAIAPSPDEVRRLPFEDLIRLGDEQGLLLSPVAVWKKHRESRNLTSHTYNEETALDLVDRIPPFAWEVQHLLERLNERNIANG